jgi:DNA-binding NarL/FixJ family response regulator
MSIKEITLQLHNSPATVKRHTINIYARLGVSQR